MERDFEVHFLAISAAVSSRTTGFCSATSNVFETNSVTLRYDVLYILWHLDGCLAVLASEPLVTRSSDLLGPGEALVLSLRVIKQ